MENSCCDKCIKLFGVLGCKGKSSCECHQQPVKAGWEVEFDDKSELLTKILAEGEKMEKDTGIVNEQSVPDLWAVSYNQALRDYQSAIKDILMRTGKMS